MKILNILFVYLILLYQKYFSFLFQNCCRFTPTCSEYSKQAFLKFSFLKAFYLSCYRILRCNPFFEGYADPIEKINHGKQ